MNSIRKSRYVMAFPVKDMYLLINGLSGAVNLVSKETAQQFFDGNVTEELKPFFTHLTPEEEYEKAKTLCTFLMKNAATCADSYLVVTYDCNLRCPYCYEIWVKRPEIMRTVMDEYTVDKAFEALEVLNRNCPGKKPLVLTGGEPLMRKNKDIIKYILKKGDDLGYIFRVFTNGVELHHFLKELSAVDVAHIQITLDGPRSLHDRRRIFKKGKGTFDIIVENIEKARTVGLPVLIRTNTDPDVLSGIEDMASFFRERGWVQDPSIRFSLAYTCDQHMNPEKFEEQTRVYEAIMNAAEKPEMDFFEAIPITKLFSVFSEPPRFWPAFWYCNAARTIFAFDPFGDVYPCPSIIGWKEQRIGVYTPELSFNKTHELWKSRTLFAVDACIDCNIALLCSGGCGYASLLNNGDLFKHVCTITEGLIAHYLQHLYEKSIHQPSR